jgi:hypothetical protein
MPDAVPHRYHSSAEFCSAGGLCDWWPLLAKSALSVSVPKPCRSTFRLWPRARSAFDQLTDGSRLEPEGLEGCPKALRRGCGKGRVRGSSSEERGTRELAQSPSVGLVPERAGWHCLRLASPRMRASGVPSRKACPLPQVGGRPVDRRSSQAIYQRQTLIGVRAVCV